MSESRVFRSFLLLVLLATLVGAQYVALHCPLQHHSGTEELHASDSQNQHHAPVSSSHTGDSKHDGHEGPDGRCLMVLTCASALHARIPRTELPEPARLFDNDAPGEAAWTGLHLPVITPPPRLLS